MGDSAWRGDIAQMNLEALGDVSPETADWLRHSRLPGPLPSGGEGPGQETLGDLDHLPGLAGGITVVVGGGVLDEVARFLRRVSPDHQVFVLEPRAHLIVQALGRHDFTDPILRERLVILPPGRQEMEDLLDRHPQLTLTRRIELAELYRLEGDIEVVQARARLYRLLGQVRVTWDRALRWEMENLANLTGNLGFAAWASNWSRMGNCLAGKTALVLHDGPSLLPVLDALGPDLGQAAVFCSDTALPHLLERGIIPTAAVLTRPGANGLWGYEHPLLAKVPLAAEETAHHPTLRAHPGPVFVCVGPRGTALGPLSGLRGVFSPQSHPLPRMAELALYMGCHPLIFGGAELIAPGGGIQMPSAGGAMVETGLYETAAAGNLGNVLRRQRVGAFTLAPGGLALTGVLVVRPDEAASLLCAVGQPLKAAPLHQSRWLSAESMTTLARALQKEAVAATRLWQRASPPLSDYPGGACRPELVAWLRAADSLFMALAERASGDPMFSGLLAGCLLRHSRHRHRLMIQAQAGGVSCEEICSLLYRSLLELQYRACELAQGLRENGVWFQELAKATQEGDRGFLRQQARALGRQPA